MSSAALHALARAHGVRSRYVDGTGRKRTAPAEALLAALRALGCPVGAPADLDGALRERKLELWRRVLQPVAVAWEGRSMVLGLRLPEHGHARRGVCRITLEDGTVVERSLLARTLSAGASETVEGTRFVERRLDLPGPWPQGYHRVQVEIGSTRAECLVVSAPRRAWGGAPSNARPRWGLFAPLYALRSQRDWGAGDFADLAGFAEWAGVQGCAAVATLPLLATFADRPFEPSPYRPVSRLFWNEMYLAIDAIPEIDASPLAREVIDSPAVRRALGRLREADNVDPRRVTALKRRVLEALARDFFSKAGSRLDAYRDHLRRYAQVEDYARFRAGVERLGESWRDWPARARDGELHDRDVDPNAARYHAFVQWLAAEQLDRVSRRVQAAGTELFCDLPLGAHPDGYDVWREREAFVLEAGAGAPPDAFHTGGQDWSFHPLHPERSRRQGHRYLRASLTHQMRVADVLRVDHVMALHRLFWIPRGFAPDQGVYVTYPTEELYAVVCLESNRHRCRVVGEDLGTVPRELRPRLRRHNLRRTTVLQLSASPRRRRPLAGLDVEGVAALSTHDTPTFASWWRGLDVGRRALEAELRRGGWLTGKSATPLAALRACLAFLADGPAELVLVQLEDLWLETRAQNVPGTTTERSNWSGRSRYALEELAGLARVRRTLGDLDRRRRQAAEKRS